MYNHFVLKIVNGHSLFYNLNFFKFKVHVTIHLHNFSKYFSRKRFIERLSYKLKNIYFIALYINIQLCHTHHHQLNLKCIVYFYLTSRYLINTKENIILNNRVYSKIYD